MRYYWSKSALASELRLDRRTVDRHLDLEGVQPGPDKGPKGHPLYRVGEAVRAFAMAGLLTRADDWRTWGDQEGREVGARDLAERLLAALAKRLPAKSLRAVRELIGAELHTYIEDLHPESADLPEGYWAGRPPNWKALTDTELDEVLRSLIEEGFVPYDEKEDS